MSPTSQITPFLKAWYKWKTLRLPWRKRFLVGLDLHGNTYWEFRLTRGAGADGRWRRIVEYPRNTHHGDVTVSPAWHQWLRNTRQAPPSLQEQTADVARQERMKVLAAQADARWAAKPSLVDAPARKPLGVRQPALGVGMQRGGLVDEATATREVREEGEQQQQQQQPEVKSEVNQEPPAPVSREETWQKMQQEQPKQKQDPWKQQRGGPGEAWQPKAWQPAATPKRS